MRDMFTQMDNAEIRRLQTENEQLLAELDVSTKALQVLNQEIIGLNTEIAMLRTERDALRVDLESVNAAIEASLKRAKAALDAEDETEHNRAYWIGAYKKLRDVQLERGIHEFLGRRKEE